MTSENIAFARARQQEKDPDGSWRNKKGAPAKGDIVAAWRLDNPHGKKTACHNATGLSFHTIEKYWDKCEFDLRGFSVEENEKRTKAGEFKDKKTCKNSERRRDQRSQ